MFIVLVMMGFSLNELSAGNVNKEVKVYGNCGMCEKRIEKAASAVDGVTSADWDVKTKIMKFTYNNEKTKEITVEKAVAAVGHDTDKVRTKDEVYKKLPDCCKYERPKKKE